jgi:hypothetical protein
MGAQTQVKKFGYSDGLSFEISTDNQTTFKDVGVMGDGAQFTFNYDKSELEAGNAENPDPLAKNLKLSIAPSDLWTWDSEAIEKLGAGLFTRTAVAGTLVEDFVQDVLSGDWSFDRVIMLSGQNYDGSEPVINSVTGSVDGAVGADDYDLVSVAGGWGLIPRDGTVFTTEVQDIEIDYDYTPAAMYELTAGTTSQVLVPYVVRFTHWTDDALTTYDWRLTVFRVSPDSGGLVFNKLGAKSDNDLDTWSVAMTGEVDSGLADGSQLFKLEMEA